MLRFSVALLALVGCTSSPPNAIRSARVLVHERQFYFIEDSAPSQRALQAAVDAAFAGDDTQLAYVISLVQLTDGEGAENFGALLVQLRDAVTTSRFHRVLASVSPQVRESAVACMEVAEKLHEVARHHQT
jgi:hypothetical protein